MIALGLWMGTPVARIWNQRAGFDSARFDFTVQRHLFDPFEELGSGLWVVFEIAGELSRDHF
jgi:hypothetical protein